MTKKKLTRNDTEAALRERIKELTCLYGISQLVQHEDLEFEELLQNILDLIPPAWQYTDITEAELILDGKRYATSEAIEPVSELKTDIVVRGRKRGTLAIYYTEEMPKLDEGPFLTEERNLINGIANQLVMIIESKRAEEEQQKLEEQLRHADRLATIGQLAAGIAHELNEPLGGILGFAQLAKKNPELPEQTNKDLDKIIESSLHARKIVKDLLIFARQAPTHKKLVNLNRTIENGLYFLESRCLKKNIEIQRKLEHDLPLIEADASQMNQVLVNLVVNAIQAIEFGGKIEIKTYSKDKSVYLVVSDTGKGMSEEVRKKIFLPFFSTKDVGEGTGLGLSVVHGIVSSHKGDISVASEEGKGASFSIRMPME